MQFGVKAPKDREKPDPNIIAMLSLKLLLLAFFILLATMSRYEEERSRAVMDSVATTFKGQIQAVVNSNKPDAALGMKDKQANLQRRIESLFKQTLPLVEVETSADGRVLRVEAAADTLFDDGEAEVIAQRGVMLRRLANALASAPSDLKPFQLEVQHAVAPNDSPAEGRLPVYRAGALVRHLVGLGLPRERLATGLWPTGGDSNRVAFEIRLPEQEPEANALPSEGVAEEAQP